jgi:hypothetical protein
MAAAKTRPLVARGAFVALAAKPAGCALTPTEIGANIHVHSAVDSIGGLPAGLLARDWSGVAGAPPCLTSASLSCDAFFAIWMAMAAARSFWPMALMRAGGRQCDETGPRRPWKYAWRLVCGGHFGGAVLPRRPGRPCVPDISPWFSPAGKPGAICWWEACALALSRSPKPPVGCPLS